MKEMKKMKLKYITPVTHWVWIGMDKEIADVDIPVVVQSQTHGSESGLVKEEDDLGDDMWSENSFPSSGGVWDNMW